MKHLPGSPDALAGEVENKMKIYIAGPMTGYEDYNRAPFHAAQAALEYLGYEVINPASITEFDLAYRDENAEPIWSDWMRAAIVHMMRADELCLLPGWFGSRGALLEKDLAKSLGIPNKDLLSYFMPTKVEKETA